MKTFRTIIIVTTIAAVGILTAPVFHKREAKPPSSHLGKEVNRALTTDPETHAIMTPDAMRKDPTETGDPREQWLDLLYGSPETETRLAAAREIASRNDEQGMSDLATFISEAEELGEPSVLALAEQVAGILGQMHGPEVEALATELAYVPSSLVAEAAVNSAVKSVSIEDIEPIDPGEGPFTAAQQSLDEYAQGLLDFEKK